jgi:hypothetical protein
MLKLHNVPSKEIRSEWAHVRFGYGSWNRLLLIECENSTIYLFRGWDQNPQFSLSLSDIADVIDSEVVRPKKNGMEYRIELKLRRQVEQPFMNRILHALKVHPTNAPGGQVFLSDITFSSRIRWLTPLMPGSQKAQFT